jgi:uncharacterized iron-regulated protein
MSAALLRRRCWAVGLLAVALRLAVPLPALAAAADPTAPAPLLPATDQLVDLRTGQPVSADTLLAELRQADVVLLGEQHDAATHHQRRGALLAALGGRAVVVAEQLTRGQQVAGGDAPLLGRLVAAGFEPAAWDWPLHQPLFAAIDTAGLLLRGGNLDRDSTRRLVREGASTLPSDLAPLLRAAPLAAAAQQALDDDLRSGHCGQLPEARLPAMRLAQRARDAAMWQALATSAGRPAVLVAGNGHVRADYGVGQLATAMSPGLRVVSIEFGETGEAPPAGPPLTTHRWLTPPQPRGDPCAGMTMPAAGASAPGR